MKIIGIVQIKGGCGRSTIATNLAAALSQSEPTALIDCDLPQGTSSSWYAARQTIKPSDSLTLATAENHLQLIEQVKQLGNGHKYLVIDAAPRIAETTRAILILSTLNLIPLGASLPEIWATQDLLNTIREAQEVKSDIDARIVWNRFRQHTRLGRDLSEAVHDQLGLDELQSKLGFRQAYTECLGSGLSVLEYGDTAAKDEIGSLVDEIKTIMKGKQL